MVTVNIRIPFIFVVFAAAMLVAASPAFAATNLATAQSKYKVSAARTIEVTSVAEIEPALRQASAKNPTLQSMWIVHVKEGTYNMTKKLDVPQFVVLVSEDKTHYVAAANITQFFTVYGSLFGGDFNANNKADYGLRFANIDLSTVGKGDQLNGWIERATVANAKKFGIVSIGSNTTYGYVYGNTVKNCGKSGIAAVEGSWLAVINRNTVSGCKESGISLSESNMNVIKNNDINNNGGHGISTDVDSKGYQDHKYCKINKLMGNSITNNKMNGVYVDKKCIVKLFSRNKIHSSGNCALSIDANGVVGSEKEELYIAKNEFMNSTRSNLNVNGGTAILGNANLFQNSKVNGVNIESKGKVILVGRNNYFGAGNKNVGISLKGKSSFVVKNGRNNYVLNNGGFGIRVDGNSICTISNMIFRDNGGFAVRVYKGSTFSFKKCGDLSTSKNAKNRVYIDSGAVLNI